MDSKLANLKANVELSDLIVVCGLSLAGALVWDQKYNDGRFWREIKSSFKSAVSLQDGGKSENADAASVKSLKSIYSLYVNPASNEDKLPASDKLETKNSDECEIDAEDCKNSEKEAETDPETEELQPNFDANEVSLEDNPNFEGNATPEQVEEKFDEDPNMEISAEKPEENCDVEPKLKSTAGQVEENCDVSDVNDQVEGDKPVSTNQENSQQDYVEPNTDIMPDEGGSKKKPGKKQGKKNKKKNKKGGNQAGTWKK